MRLGIMSDIHLGSVKFRKMQGLQNAYGALNYELFGNGIDILLEQNVDAILIAGDLFDSPNPSVQSIVVANKLSEIDIPVVLLGGNHEYSQKNRLMGYHPFQLIWGKNVHKVIDQAEIFEFDGLHLAMIPYKSLNPDSFAEIYQKRIKSAENADHGKKYALAFHGFVDLKNTDDMEEYALPKQVALNYDLVIAGHVHLPYLAKTKSTSILVPGSPMPSAQAAQSTQKPAVYVYTTESAQLQSFEIPNVPEIFEIYTDDINKSLVEIAENEQKNNIYSVHYSGKVQDVDELIYKKACQNALNISLSTNDQMENIAIKKVSEFWKFVEDEHPEYYAEFKDLLKGE